VCEIVVFRVEYIVPLKRLYIGNQPHHWYITGASYSGALPADIFMSTKQYETTTTRTADVQEFGVYYLV
jgi:hypothetical protein